MNAFYRHDVGHRTSSELAVVLDEAEKTIDFPVYEDLQAYMSHEGSSSW